MTNEETAGGMGEPHWFVANSCALQQVGKVAHGQKWEWPVREALEVKASPLVCAFWHGPHSGQHKTLLGAHSKGPIPPDGKWPHHPCHHFPG